MNKNIESPIELTIEQVLQQGMTMHKKGKLQEAEHLYRAILQSQPAHPDANHNLGVLAVSVNKAEAALPLFKTALEANPKIEQFWLSYIDALIKEQQFDNAKQVLEQAKRQGVAKEKLNVLETQLTPTAEVNEPKLAVQNKSLSLSQKRKRLSEQKKRKKTTKQNLETNNPSQQQLKSLLEHYQNGRFRDAEKLSVEITQDFPEHQFAWKVLGAVLAVTGRESEALDAKQTAVALSPQDAEAISNLGSTLKELGRLDEAEASCRKAIALKPDLSVFHVNLGITLQELGRLDEAIASYSQAILLEPDFAEAYVALSITIKNVKFHSPNRKLYPVLIQLLTSGNFTRPTEVAGSILSLLKHDIQIKHFLLETNVVMSLKEATSIIGSLDKLTLLHHLMRACPLPELQFEGLFVRMRSFFLTNLDKIEASPELIYFLSSLSLHCFTNEYIYFESDEETQLIDELENNVMQIIAQSGQPEAIKILCLASYRPLYQYDWCKILEMPDDLEEVKRRLIEEPLSEKVIAQDIPVLGEISDNVSLKVRGQYEENPYPRWVKLAISKARSISEVCDDSKLHLHSKSIKNVTTPAILIAGCGTGIHSIETACRFSSCHVTAVDLSLASLAYAQRKTTELGLGNLKYLQADILKLDHLEQEFDIIESVGVLHHMDEPMVGWRALVDLLKPGGLMRIGLYSELARSQITKARREIASLGIGTSATEIRNFRESLRVSESKNQKRLSILTDFFSLSEFRDLVFHVQEHRFTLPQIKNCLDELGLKFCGFTNRELTSNFRKFHDEGSDICDLMLWHEFEERNPDTFLGMYQFWCQKTSV